MKNQVLLSAFCLFLISCFLISCSDGTEENDPIEETTVEADFFKCTINGELYEVKGFGAYALKSSTEDNVTNLYGAINLNDPDAMQVTIAIKDDVTTGSMIDFDDDDFFAFIQESGNQYSTYSFFDGSGTMTIDEKTEERISGTFSFIAGDSQNPEIQMTVSEGSFDLNYQ